MLVYTDPHFNSNQAQPTPDKIYNKLERNLILIKY